MMFLSHVYFLTTLFLCLLYFLLDSFHFVLSLPFMVEAVLKCLVFLSRQNIFKSEAPKYLIRKHECGLSISESHCRVATIGSFIQLGEISKCLYPQFRSS